MSQVITLTDLFHPLPDVLRGRYDRRGHVHRVGFGPFWTRWEMKPRRHHNNHGRRSIRRGKTRDQVKRIAKRLKVKYGETLA